MEKKITVEEVVTYPDGGGFYDIEGNLANGNVVAEVALGEVSPSLYRITRRIKALNLETKKLYCECGRVFQIDNDLSFVKCNY